MAINPGPGSLCPRVYRSGRESRYAPFARGASFQSTTVEALVKHDRKSLGELLQCTIKLLQQNPHVSSLPGPTVIDVANLKDLPGIQQILASSETAVLSYGYGRSIVPVSRKMHSFPEAIYAYSF